MPRPARLFRPLSAVAFALGIALLLNSGGCAPERREIVVYCALDQEHAASILEEFEKQSGIHVSPRFDDEITKTVGLTKSILLVTHSVEEAVAMSDRVVMLKANPGRIADQVDLRELPRPRRPDAPQVRETVDRMYALLA